MSRPSCDVATVLQWPGVQLSEREEGHVEMEMTEEDELVEQENQLRINITQRADKLVRIKQNKYTIE